MKELYSVSGIYPHLAVTNGDGEMECGIGAVVPWAGKLWYLTYPPSSPKGSSADLLYILDDDLTVESYPHSIGGTHANRMIHRESNQLIIGPYFIDAKGGVRVVPPDPLKGRLTGVARHLTDPANKVYFFSMESGLYEVDVYSLAVKTYFLDPSPVLSPKPHPYLLPGEHAKGAYSGQGRLVVTNNGDGGALAEWVGGGDPGKQESWNIIDRNKYTDITGPGDIYGSSDDNDPLWALGWDHKSVLLSLCEDGVWSRFRLPKGSHTHEADNGWYTEWPRIREVGADKWLMDMFGQLFDFPATFSKQQTAGIRPLAVHHKMIVDFTNWNDRLVMACNDASKFDNRYLGRAQSNLWFTSREELEKLGEPVGWGGVWIEEYVEANVPSDPYLLAGFKRRVLHLRHTEKKNVTFRVEIDRKGNGTWEPLHTVNVSERGYAYYMIPDALEAEWARIQTNEKIVEATAYFSYMNSTRTSAEPEIIQGLSAVGDSGLVSAGILRPDRDRDLTLQFASSVLDADGQIKEQGYYEIGHDMVLRSCDRPEAEERIRSEFTPALDFSMDDASIIMKDSRGSRYRLPKGNEAYNSQSGLGWPRGIREVVTERSLMNIHGTFYELPRDLSRGIATIQPICSHQRRIYDYASWRGMLVISGCRLNEEDNEHVLKSADGKAGLWFGNVDDLRKFGVPSGIGGPLKDTLIQPGVPSDPYLMTGYLHKKLELSHDHTKDVRFTIEIDFLADGTWVPYGDFTVSCGTTTVHCFPDAFHAHWVRVIVDRSCHATATFTYE